MGQPLKSMRIRQDSLKNTFGMVRNQGTKPHQGWDLAAPIGTPVYAIGDGVIEDVSQGGDYGLTMTLRFTRNGRRLYAFYAHLSLASRAKGDKVSEGDLIALTGNSGNASNFPASEDHLHFELRTVPYLGKGSELAGRVDPGSLLGFGVLSCPISPQTEPLSSFYDQNKNMSTAAPAKKRNSLPGY